MRRPALTSVFVVSVLATTLTTRLPANQAGSLGRGPSDPLEITATASNMPDVGTGGTAMIDISVKSWTTPADRTRIIGLLEKGTPALLFELRKSAELGRYRVPGVIGADPHQLRGGQPLRYAWQTMQANGIRRIVLAAERYLSPEAIKSEPRAADYPFTVIEIRADAVGDGDGKMALASKLTFDKASNTLTLEDYDNAPIRLTRVTVRTLAPLR
jgi:hypothetical protein